MGRVFLTMMMVMVAGGAGACSQGASRDRTVPPLYVPSAAIIQGGGAGNGGTALAYGVLPSSDAETLFVPRAEKFVYGPYVLQASSAYSIYTFDQQVISSFWGPSYRDRSVVQQGITVP